MLYSVLKNLIVTVHSIRGFPGDSGVKIHLPVREMQETQIDAWSGKTPRAVE